MGNRQKKREQGKANVNICFFDYKTNIYIYICISDPFNSHLHIENAYNWRIKCTKCSRRSRKKKIDDKISKQCVMCTRSIDLNQSSFFFDNTHILSEHQPWPLNEKLIRDIFIRRCSQLTKSEEKRGVNFVLRFACPIIRETRRTMGKKA